MGSAPYSDPIHYKNVARASGVAPSESTGKVAELHETDQGLEVTVVWDDASRTTVSVSAFERDSDGTGGEA